MASYILRKIDPELWDQFRERAQLEGHPMRWLLLRLITHYITHGLPKD